MSDLASYRMSRGTRRVLASLVPVICPPECAQLGLAGDVLAGVELSMRSMPRPVRLGLVAGLVAFDLSAIPFRLRRASSLPAAAAAAHFDRWRHGLGIQRELAKGVRALLAMSYYDQPAVLDRLGYTAEAWIEKVKERRLASYGVEIAAHEASIFARDPVPLPSEVEAKLSSEARA